MSKGFEGLPALPEPEWHDNPPMYGQRQMWAYAIEHARQLAEERAELLEALKWAMPMASAGVEMYRMERVKSGHLDIQGTYKNGTTWAGIYQSEVDEIERAEAAIANATQQRNATGGEG